MYQHRDQVVQGMLRKIHVFVSDLVQTMRIIGTFEVFFFPFRFYLLRLENALVVHQNISLYQNGLLYKKENNNNNKYDV